VTDDGDSRQRVWGDFQQMKSVGTCFYGAFTGNGQPLGRTFSTTDPIYFQVCQSQIQIQNPCVLATTTISAGMNVSDRTHITASVDSGGLFQLGSQATVTGNVLVNNNAFLRDNSTIVGNLTLAGVLQHQNIFTITGTLTQNATVSIPTLLVRTVTPGTGTTVVANNAVVTLNPGQYGDVIINAGAKVTFLAGTYNMKSLNIQPDVTITDNAATAVNVAGALTWSDRVKVQSTITHPLTLYSNGTSIRVGTDGIFNGFLITPNASLDIASRTSFQGCVGAHDITFEPDVILNSGGSTLPAAATM
jgi:ribosomal protein S8E